MLFLLDTNTISALMKEDQCFLNWLSSLRSGDQLVTCTIVRGEVLFGLAKLASGRRRSELEAKAEKLFGSLPCESVPPAAANYYATVKMIQQSRGLSLDENDLWIAATSIALGAALVSRDSDFQRVDNLVVIAP